jgi:polyisoprenoid-binding protein YceI
MKLLLCVGLAGALAASHTSLAPNVFATKTGQVRFEASSPLEDIEATNNATSAVLNLTTAQLAFAVPVAGFKFKRTLMQEHFNENYMESEKYPLATFKGRLAGGNPADLATPGPHVVQVSGELAIHGVTHTIAVPATLELKGGQLLASTQFDVAPADYNITIPLLVRSQVAKVAHVRVALACAPQ